MDRVTLEPAPPPRPYPVEAVLFDFHGPIAQVEDEVDWVLAAAAECRLNVDSIQATSLADRLITAGRAGGRVPDLIPEHLVDAYDERDLIPGSHRTAYVGLAETVVAEIEGLADALYERILRPEGWRSYADTLPTLRLLHESHVPVAVVRNIGFDIRPFREAFGFAKYVESWILSYEVGLCKPNPDIFQFACQTLGVATDRALMVGDTPADAAAVNAGCRVLVLPAGPPGAVNGLAAALSLALG